MQKNINKSAVKKMNLLEDILKTSKFKYKTFSN